MAEIDAITIRRLESRIARLEAVVTALTAPARDAAADEAAAPVRMSIRQIAAAVAAEYGVPAAEMAGHDTRRAFSVPRQEAMRRAWEAGFSTPQIGRVLGGRDHSTVMHGIKRARERMAAE